MLRNFKGAGKVYLIFAAPNQLKPGPRQIGTPDENMATLPYSGCPLLLPTASSTYIIK
jgi:hypothetical protein